MGILDEIAEKRGKASVGGNPFTFTELLDGKIIHITPFEPDPRTFREEWYYNSRQNKLYRKVETSTVPFWKPVTNY